MATMTSQVRGGKYKEIIVIRLSVFVTDYFAFLVKSNSVKKKKKGILCMWMAVFYFKKRKEKSEVLILIVSSCEIYFIFNVSPDIIPNG